MYSRQIESELVQHFVSGNLSLKLTLYTEREAKFLKARYYKLELKENGKVIFAPIADSHVDRAFNEFDTIRDAMANISNKGIKCES